MTGRRLPLWAGLSALLLVASTALLAARREKAVVAKSPEEAVRLFVEACEKGNWATARALFTERSKPKLVPVRRLWSDLREALARRKPLWYPLSKAVKGGFDVRPEREGRVPLSARSTFNFAVVREGEGWKIDLPKTFGMGAEDYARFVKDWHEQALSEGCQSNLRQIALAMRMYIADWDGGFPPANKWCDALRPYVRSFDLFTCPAVAERGGRWGYAMNWKLSRRRLSEIERPVHTVLFYETESLRKSACGDGRDMPKEGRHMGGNNFAFVDGHVKWLRADIEEPVRLFRLKKGPGFRFPPRFKGREGAVPSAGFCPLCR